MRNTLSLFLSKLTPQFAKKAGGATSCAGGQADLARVSRGFTIAELMIATSVFSVILLVGAAAFINLGQSYYKGVTVTQTQEVAKQIINNVSSNIRLSSTVSGLNTATGSRYFYCVGGNRYTFQLYKEIDTSNHDNTSNFGLLFDSPNGDGCGNPYDSPTVPLVNPTEMLGNHMRLLAFSISPVGSTTAYAVKVTVASGADDTLTSPISASSSCTGSSQASQFCAVSTISTVVYEGVST